MNWLDRLMDHDRWLMSVELKGPRGVLVGLCGVLLILLGMIVIIDAVVRQAGL